jgi:hypothetical protein
MWAKWKRQSSEIWYYANAYFFAYMGYALDYMAFSGYKIYALLYGKRLARTESMRKIPKTNK